jgi:hypothetical protein
VIGPRSITRSDPAGFSAGYPPDLQDAAVQNVLQQAEVLSAQWAA